MKANKELILCVCVKNNAVLICKVCMQHILFSRLQINRTVIVLNVFCHNMWVTINQIKALKCQIHTRCVLICTFHSQSFHSMNETSWQSNWSIWCREKKNFAPLLKIESKNWKQPVDRFWFVCHRTPWKSLPILT